MDLMMMFDTKRAEFQRNDVLPTLSQSEREDFEERSAIMEYIGKLPRAEAEKRALEITLQRRQYHDGGSCDG